MLKTILTLISACLCAVASVSTHAQDNFPNKPVRMIVPFPAGQATDIIARLMADSLGKLWGQQVVVENRPGVPGMMAGRDAPADGYTITLGTSGTLAVNPGVFSKLPYDTARDYAFVSGGSTVPMIIVASPSLPYNTLRELVDAAKKEPGKFNIGYGGVNNTQHLTGEYLKSRAGINMVGINYKGSAAAVTDLLGGQILLLVDSLAATLPHIRAGKIKALAITSLERAPQLPDVPTVAELGYPGFEGVGWAGLIVPKGTPHAIVDKIGADARRVLSEAAMRERVADRGMVVDLRGPREWSEFVNAEVAKWGSVAKQANVRASD